MIVTETQFLFLYRLLLVSINQSENIHLKRNRFTSQSRETVLKIKDQRNEPVDAFKPRTEIKPYSMCRKHGIWLVSVLSLNESIGSFLWFFIFKTVSLDYESRQTHYQIISNDERCRLNTFKYKTYCCGYYGIKTHSYLLRLAEWKIRIILSIGFECSHQNQAE